MGSRICRMLIRLISGWLACWMVDLVDLGIWGFVDGFVDMVIDGLHLGNQESEKWLEVCNVEMSGIETFNDNRD